MRDGEAKPAEYSRVTDPGRYAVLHDAADRLLDELTDRYIVERRESREPLRVVHLIPHAPDAAPLAVAFTGFPGLTLRLGRWYEEALPNCGCDACDEQPDELIADLRRQVSALIEGGLWERVRRGVTGSWSEARLIGTDITAGCSAPLDPRDARAARRDGFAAAVQWAPWPRRSPGKLS
ncbi:MAG TPA: DUF6226 family protein [Actinoplanes sp.]|nr:DUF6226 family protein [Actinoplanes sp.]